MSKSLLDTVISFIEPCYTNIYYCLEYVAISWQNILNKEKEKWLSFDYEIRFDKAQINALCFLIVVFVLNTLSVLIIWRFHGHQVFKKFKKPAPPRVFEELSRSLSNLKLPKVHSPRM